MDLPSGEIEFTKREIINSISQEVDDAGWWTVRQVITEKRTDLEGIVHTRRVESSAVDSDFADAFAVVVREVSLYLQSIDHNLFNIPPDDLVETDD